MRSVPNASRYPRIVSAHPPAPPGTAFEWVVGPEMIDLDRWARVYVRVQRGGTLPGTTDDGASPPLHQRHPAAFAGCLLVVTIAGMLLVGLDPWSAAFIPLAVLIAFVTVFQLTAPARVAKQLRSMPAMREPFRFTAGPGGTSCESGSGRDQLLWSRYERAELHDDLLALVMQGGAVRLLPTAGFVGTEPPESVAATIGDWIRASRAVAT
jgi:hypothetical protein